ncbi:putative glycolipid-binding domain-containing protein [Wenxinia marina]|uniref:Glycolipid-binding domain-containing protein n=1 Tax=Wenxinia marina DSM 24838 TaxID=1123501 RepID=A0A0D0Q8S2_9RHOB|nr:putative glycolipid-binding domain-containing protein [Wenxinia marina]KIQ70799.1 hypothetical protein Wenmar_00173 [Wenxinia marina DSM 24838]GGL57212.1 hypothetical protein GCM10011392_09590 [Wenxinia marina]
MIAGAHAVLWTGRAHAGTDACRFIATGNGLLIEGSASLAADTVRYRVRADAEGRTVRARVGLAPSLRIERDPEGRWTLNGARVPEVDGAEDVDLGFTPATNTLPIRRLRLEVGQSADVTAAWLDDRDWTLKSLRQTYHRTGETAWHYTAGEFEADLEVNRFGVVERYGSLWTI